MGAARTRTRRPIFAAPRAAVTIVSLVGLVVALVASVASEVNAAGAADNTSTTPTPVPTLSPTPVTYPVIGNLVQGIYTSLLNPAAAPAGVNVPSCRPSSAHPRPVVLIGGTFSNMVGVWGGLGPTLANQGYCVYSTPFGGDPTQAIQSVGPIPTSLSTVATFVDQVLAHTGATKVDFIGASQGGMLGELYLKFVAGARSKVANYIGIAPPTHGTTFNGLVTLAQLLPPLLPVVNATVIGTICPACVEQQIGSTTVNVLNYGPITQPGVNYTVIDTYWEDVVTPVGSAFINEPGVSNKYLQTYCPYSLSDHVLLTYDPGVWGLVANALDPTHQVKVSC